MATTAEERALARATFYRALALAFSYPTPEVTAEIREAFTTAAVAAELIDESTRASVTRARAALEPLRPADLEKAYQQTFTLSYSEDCPLYETAFSARHLFQQAQQQADLAGTYQAFGVRGRIERPDHLAVELEFSYLLALKEARARHEQEGDHIQICRDASRAFLRQHLARWAPLVGRRVAVTGAGTWYEVAARALETFVAWEQRFLRVGAIEMFRDEPIIIAEEPGEMTCPVAEEAFAELLDSPWKEHDRVS